MHICTYYCYFKSLDHSLKPQTLGSTVTKICPDEATSTEHPQQPFHILRLSPANSSTTRYFHLSLHYEDHSMVMNVSLDTADINAVNISTLDFRIWQHFSSNWTPPHLQKLTNVPEVPVTQLYSGMINTSEPIHSFTIKDDDEGSSLIRTILKHPGTYIGTICEDFSFCCLTIVQWWILLKQNIWLSTDKLSSTSVDFIRSSWLHCLCSIKCSVLREFIIIQ